MEILDSKSRYKGAPAEDIKVTINAVENAKPLNEYDIIKLLKVNEQFAKEQRESRDFRIHGSLNLISSLSNRPKVWDSLNVTVQEYQTVNKQFSLNEDFEMYFGYVSEYVPIFTASNDFYQQKVKILNVENPVSLINCGFAQNIYKEKFFNYVIDNEISINNLKSIGLPINCPVTDILLYVKPKSDYTTLDFTSVTDYTAYQINENSELGFEPNFIATQSFINKITNLFKPVNFTHLTDLAFYDFIMGIIIIIFQINDLKITIANITLNQELILIQSKLLQIGNFVPGDALMAGYILGDIVKLNRETLELETVIKQVNEVKQLITNNLSSSLLSSSVNYGFDYMQIGQNINIEFSFIYDCFINIELLDKSSFLEVDTLNNIAEIPDFSLVDTNLNQVKWRDVLSPGFIEPNTGKGFDYPFVNGCHYVFSKNTLFMKPNLGHYNTFRLFKSSLASAKVNDFNK